MQKALIDYSKFVDGMKIIPLQSNELKKIVQKGIKYKEMYGIFDNAYNSELPPHKWYEETLEVL